MPALPFYQYQKTVVRPYKKGYPITPQTLGEHIKKVRMDKGLLQKEIAAMINVSEDTITYWENGRFVPQVQYYPVIISFIGYYPFSHETESMAGKLKQVRYCNGLNITKCAKLLAIDIATVKRYEAGYLIKNATIRTVIYNLWLELSGPQKTQYRQD
ncbi:helix-turn-helix transcriptional regulator [Mucilaginibacter sp. X4EP1]|uniref:helix-turn-helix transcriptional regulator n=1 Tax=Mucilaginibacter sp. X4EP1 TaxID=2723092 RepID=UPI003B0018EE